MDYDLTTIYVKINIGCFIFSVLPPIIPHVRLFWFLFTRLNEIEQGFHPNQQNLVDMEAIDLSTVQQM